MSTGRSNWVSAVAYRYDWIRGFVEVRQGFNGYSGQVADFGVDFIANPTEDLQLMVGPRASWGSADYMKTYFGVSAKEAAVPGSILEEYDADPGFNRLGVAATASYGITDTTTFHVRAGWDRLVGDAADSPIVKEGSEEPVLCRRRHQLPLRLRPDRLNRRFPGPINTSARPDRDPRSG